MRYDFPIPYGWYCLDYADGLAIGEVRALHFFGRDLVMFRTETGKPVVMDAYCPHLGAHLGVGGKVQGESIQCPFHAWRFDTAGICVDIPYASQIPAKIAGKNCVHSYPVAECNQGVWVWYHPQNVAPLFDIEKIPELDSDDWTPTTRFEWTIRTVIQEAGENGVDTPHFQYVHSAGSTPVGDVTIEGHMRTTDVSMKTPEIDDNGVRDTTGTRWVDGHLISRSCGPGQAWQRFSGNMETVMLATMIPIDSEHMRMRFAFTQMKNQSVAQKMMAEGVVQHVVLEVQQDIPIWENKKYQANPVLCDGDGPIARYRKWFSQFYGDAVVN